ncbi:MAG: hypothetical protein HQM09_19270 [Candidatus Riflebacteria bacterium]|nr:hypothetical protein [Candidatus Riflebacteria bacterium]
MKNKSFGEAAAFDVKARFLGNFDTHVETKRVEQDDVCKTIFPGISGASGDLYWETNDGSYIGLIKGFLAARSVVILIPTFDGKLDVHNAGVTGSVHIRVNKGDSKKMIRLGSDGLPGLFSPNPTPPAPTAPAVPKETNNTSSSQKTAQTIPETSAGASASVSIPTADLGGPYPKTTGVGLAPGESAYYHFYTDKAANMISIQMTTADWTGDLDLMASNVKPPTSDQIVSRSSMGANGLWYGPVVGTTNESLGMKIAAPAGTIIYVTVCNRSKTRATAKLYWSTH